METSWRGAYRPMRLAWSPSNQQVPPRRVLTIGLSSASGIRYRAAICSVRIEPAPSATSSPCAHVRRSVAGELRTSDDGDLRRVTTVGDSTFPLPPIGSAKGRDGRNLESDKIHIAPTSAPRSPRRPLHQQTAYANPRSKVDLAPNAKPQESAANYRVLTATIPRKALCGSKPSRPNAPIYR